MTRPANDDRERASRTAARWKRRAALQAPIRSVVESLEDRVLLTVTTDANGFVEVTPSATSRLIYVSSSAGSDSNSGLSPNAPVASVAKAYSLIRNGYPDWVLLNRGDTFKGGFTYFSDSGPSSQQPIVITNYGNPALPQPVVDAGASEAFRTGSYNANIDIIGINFTSSTHNPSSPNYTGAGDYGFYSLGNTHNVLIEDCTFSYFLSDITFTDYYGPMSNVTIYGDDILDSYATAGHSQGLYADNVTNLTIENSTFDHDGWNTSVSGAQANIFNHDCYLHASNVNVVVENNIFADASSFGLEARAGGIVDNNLFIGDPYGFAYGLVNGNTNTPGGVSGQVIGNVVLEPRVDNANGYGVGAMIGNLMPGGNTVISDNIFADETGASQPAMFFAPGIGDSNPDQAVGINTVTVSNNVTYNWGFGIEVSGEFTPGSTGQYGLSGVLIENNDFQHNNNRIIDEAPTNDPRYQDWSGNTYSSTTPTSNWFEYDGGSMSLASWIANIEPTAIAATVPFVNPSETIESYMASQGMAGTLAAFVATADQQTDETWNPVYTASTVNGYIQSGFAVDNTTPAAVDAPPADVTAANYLTDPTPTFTVAYTDSVAINPLTITGSEVAVTGVGGFTLPVSLMSTSGSGTSITATYQISPPNNDWTTVPNGTYVISMAANQVENKAGTAVPAETLDSFQVTVNPDPNPPTAAATTPINLTAVAGTSNINVSWSDPAGDQRSFILTRATDAAFTQNVTNFPQTADATSYTDDTVVVGQTYYYELTAVNPLGASAPAVAASGVAIVPPAPAFTHFILDDGNPARSAIFSATLNFTQPVTVTPADVTLVDNTTSTPVATTLANPTGDGKTWIVTWDTSLPGNPLLDGNYSLTMHGGLVSDAFGQTAGGDVTTTFNSLVPPVVANAVYFHTSFPHSVSLAFSEDVSKSLSVSDLTVTNASGVAQQLASVSWNASTLTATWTFAKVLAGGNYTATLNAAGVTNYDGVELDGNGNGIPGGNYVFAFTDTRPTLASISGPANINVNAPYVLTLGAITDVGQTNPTYLVHWGDGTTSSATLAGTLTHSYTSAQGATTITVDVIDGNGNNSDVASLALTVNQPTLAISGNSNANPGAPYTLNFGAANDPGYTVKSYIVHWGDGSVNTYSAAAIAAAGGMETYVYSNPGVRSIAYQIMVDVVDNSGSGGTSFTTPSAATLPVTVNAAPSVSLNGSPDANIGGTYTLNIGAISDPGFTVSQLTVNWGDGSQPVIVSPTTTQVSYVYSAGAPTNDVITVSLTDNSGSSPAAGTFRLTVNPSPTLSLSGNSGASVGVPYALTVPAAVDPGQTVSTYTINWGDGNTTVTATPGTFYYTYSAAISANITVDLTDGEGTYLAAGSLPINVILTPLVSLSGNSQANATGTYSMNLGLISDPFGTPYDYVVNWGDSSSTTVTATGLLTHTYTTAGPADITVNVDDVAGSWTDVGSLPITVQPPPTITVNANSYANAAGTYTLNLGAANDPGYSPSVTVNWGDGQSTVAAPNTSPTHVYDTVGSNYNITVDLADSTGTYTDVWSQAVSVNSAPTIAVSGAPSTNTGVPYIFTLGAVSDPGYNVTQYLVNWGDGSVNTYSAVGNFAHIYSAPADATISVSMTDATGTYSNVATLPVVAATPPTLLLTGSSIADMDETYSLLIRNVVDTNSPTYNFVINWGDSTSDTAAAAGVVTHTFSSAGPDNITVDMSDPYGSWTDVASLPITVLVNRTIALSGNSDANANGVYTLNVGAANDPGNTISQVSIDWGDGQTSTGLPGRTVTHVYTTPSTYNISADIVDATGSYPAGTESVTVNPAPTIALSGASSTDINNVYSLNLGAVNDPGYTASRYLVHWGDNTASTYTAPGVVTHVYHAEADATISVDLTDVTGTYVTAGALGVNVYTPPKLTLTGAANANIGGLYSLTLGSLVDPNGTPTQYVVHWGDGAVSKTSSLGTLTHPYTTAGPETITVDVTDPGGTFTAAASHVLTVDPKPTLALTGNSTATTGVAYTLNLSTVTDPGYTPTLYTIHWGDGTTTTSTRSGGVTHVYSATQTAHITVDLADSTGTYTGAGAMQVGVYPPSLFKSSVDVGAPKVTGQATYASGVYTVIGAGTGIASTADQFHFYETSTSGTTHTISAQISSLAAVKTGSVAGVMMRASTANNAAFADVVVTAAGTLEFQYRTATKGKISQTTLAAHSAPILVKLIRKANVFSAWYSYNGTTWTQLGTNHTISLPTAAVAGLVASSTSTTQTTSATFTNVTLT